ncbi:hypothetical protein BpHYR1_043041, partial [Brachionus plicatilis]
MVCVTYGCHMDCEKETNNTITIFADKTNALLSLMEETCIEQLEQRLLIRNPNATYEEIIKISSKLFGRNPIYNDPLMEFVHRTQLQN